MNLMFFLLSALDIVGGLSYLFYVQITFLYLIILGKGVWSMFSCLISKDYFYIIFGFIDVVCGLFGVLGLFSFQIAGIALLLKGVYSIIFSF